MCHSRVLNSKTNNPQERTLRIVYQDKKSNFETLLKCKKSASIRMDNLQYLSTEVFNVKIGLSPKIIKQILYFQEHETSSARSGN